MLFFFCFFRALSVGTPTFIIEPFCFADRDFATASPPITSFSFSEKEKEGKRKTAQGTAPRSEIHYVAAGKAATQ